MRVVDLLMMSVSCAGVEPVLMPGVCWRSRPEPFAEVVPNSVDLLTRMRSQSLPEWRQSSDERSAPVGEALVMSPTCAEKGLAFEATLLKTSIEGFESND